MKVVTALSILSLLLTPCAARSAPLPGDSTSLDVLIESLKSEDSGTRYSAIHRIYRLGPDATDAVPALIELLENNKMVESAVHALKEIGPGAEEAMPILFRTFTAYPKHPAARWKAAEALANIGDPAIPTLIKGIESKNVYEEIWSHAALAKMEGTESDHFQFLLDTMASNNLKRVKVALRGLSMIGPEAKETLPQLIAALDNPVMDCRVTPKTDIICLLGRMKKDAVPAIPKLVALLDDETGWMVSFRAIQALGQIGGAEAKAAVPSLIRLLSQEQQDYHRKYIADTLGAIGPAASDAIPALIEQLNSDLSNRARTHAATALRKIALDDPKVRKVLIDAMKNSDKSLRGSIAQDLSHSVPATKEWIGIFVALYNDKHISLHPLGNLFSNAKPKDRKLFPKEIRERGEVSLTTRQ